MWTRAISTSFAERLNIEFRFRNRRLISSPVKGRRPVTRPHRNCFRRSTASLKTFEQAARTPPGSETPGSMPKVSCSVRPPRHARKAPRPGPWISPPSFATPNHSDQMKLARDLYSGVNRHQLPAAHRKQYHTRGRPASVAARILRSGYRDGHFPGAEESRPKTKTRQARSGLDRSLHIRSAESSLAGTGAGPAGRC
jgi:hypothetical protein